MKAFISAFRNVNKLELNLVENMLMFKDLMQLGVSFEQVLGVYTDKNNITSEELSFMVQLDSMVTTKDILKLADKYVQESVLIVSEESVQFNLAALYYTNGCVEVLGTMVKRYKLDKNALNYSYVPRIAAFLTIE